MGQLASRLEQEGWTVETSESAGGSRTRLIGKRHDEIGLETQIWMAHLSETGEEGFASLRDKAPAGAEVLAIVDVPIDSELIERAASQGIVLVGANDLEARI